MESSSMRACDPASMRKNGKAKAKEKAGNAKVGKARAGGEARAGELANMRACAKTEKQKQKQNQSQRLGTRRGDGSSGRKEGRQKNKF